MLGETVRRACSLADVPNPYGEVLSLIAFAGAHMPSLFYDSLRRSLFRAAPLALVCIAQSHSVFSQSAHEKPAAACSSASQSDSAKVGSFKFTTYSSDAATCLQVTNGGKTVFRRVVEGDEQFTLGQPADAQLNIPAIANGTDVTGRGHPNMIVSLFTGGAHCCTSHMVFELEPEFKLLATLEDAHDDMAHFALDRQDRRYYYHTADWTFAYWPDCFACSPSEAVILRWVDDAKGSGLHLAFDKMQRPAPSAAEWSRNLAAVRKIASDADTESIGRTLWQTVLDLIYTGHSDLAWKFVDEAGPKAQQKPLPSLGDFCGLLKQSAYWPDLGPTLKNPPPACTNAKPAGTK
jgi:hypothetical protein